MYTVVETDGFAAWLASIKDAPTRLRLARRIDKARRGLLGDVKALGDGLYEMREFFGPGWRMYYLEQDGMLVIMLGGGDKSSQPQDIAQARHLVQEFRR